MFVSGDATDQKAAKLVCRHCPVRQDCLDEFYLLQDVVVGGTTWNDRLAALRRGEEPNAVADRLRDMFTRPGATYVLDYMGISGQLAMRLQGRYKEAKP